MLGLLLQQKTPVAPDAETLMTENPEALALLAGAAAEAPNDVIVQKNYGAVLYALDRTVDAIDAYTRAIEADPSRGEVYVYLGNALMNVCRQDDALYAYRHAVTIEPAQYPWSADLIFITDMAPATTFETALAARRRFNAHLVAPVMPTSPTYPNDRDPNRKLRIGYVSADMYRHSGATTWGGWLVNHTRAAVHVTLYSATVKTDDLTTFLRRKCDQWYDVQDWSDARLAEQIRTDQIDILVDLAGYSNGGRLGVFALRPAPIQVSGWGYATGLGLDCMDAFATDARVVRPNESGLYHEEPWYLPSALTWVPTRDSLAVGHLRAALGRPFTFGVFNRQPKLTPDALRAWVAILRRVPGSRLLVKNAALGAEQIAAATTAAFVQAGAVTRDGSLVVEAPGAVSTIELYGGDGHMNHLAAHWAIDLMLDPFPMTGGVSAYESAWMGVPLVTLTGDRPVGRITTSLLHQVGLEDFCTTDIETYIERAVAAARDIPRLVGIRETLRDRLKASPSLDLKGYAKAVEAGYRQLWQRWVVRTAQDEAA